MTAWHSNPRPGMIPRALRTLDINEEVTFYLSDNHAPPGQLWDRVSYYISKLRMKDKTKLFARAHIENVGVVVRRYN